MTVFVLNRSSMRIRELIEQPSIRVWSSINDVPSYALAGVTLGALERVDAIVLEITESDPDVQYVLAQAIILQKPTMCVYAKNREPREMLTQLAKKTIPKCIHTKSYTGITLQPVLQKFIQSIQPEYSIDEIPNIKFTLRLTKTLDNYLAWLARERNLNKAEYMRGLIQKELDQDDTYNAL